MRSLFDFLEQERHHTWVPPTPPSLTGVDEVCIDTETTGLRWWDNDQPIGISIRLPNGQTFYLPWGHKGGGNLSESIVKEWAYRELRGKHLIGMNIRFDIHQMKAWGIDLEEQSCTVSDISHYSALLDGLRYKNDLESIAQDYLGVGKLGDDLDKTRMSDYHAGEVAAYAERDVELVHQLKEKMWPMLDEQDLQRVRALEDKVIFTVCEMERNGAPIDVELLDRWLTESQRKYEECLWKLIKLVGFQVDPKRPEHMKRLFEYLKLPIEYLPAKPGKKPNPSFTNDILKRIDHPAIHLVHYAARVASIRSKYLVKYRNTVDSNGIVRYSLHQLRAQKDELDEGAGAGTITGRFSSTGMSDGSGINVQQELKTAKQRVLFGYDENDSSHDDEIFIIRQLRIPPKGRQWLSADAMQIEYRIFASYANNPRVIEAYKQNPLLKFHNFMHDLLRPYADLTYRQQKDLNFAVIYSAGLAKIALMMGHITQTQFNQIRQTEDYNSPLLQKTKEVRRIYDREVPEVKDLLAKAAHLAKPHCDDRCQRNDQLHRTESHRGYVCTVLGRRSRFPDGQRSYKSLNSIIQGGAADIAKQKTIELHKERKYTGLTMRYVVHDEVDGDVDDETSARRVEEVLNRQSFKQLTVPILWEVSIGENWAACKDLPSEFQGIHETRAQINYENTGKNRP